MDNDNKIKDVKKEVQLFLKNDKMFSELEKPELYDLEAEYAKTKKNKSTKNLITILVTVAVVAALSAGISAFIEHQNNNIEVGIDVFDDLNLKNLLNMVGQTKDELNQARDEKKSLELDMNSELNRVDLALEAEKNLIEKKRISKATKASQIEEAEAKAAAEKKQIRAQYDKKIASVKITISDLEDELEKYESSNLERAQQQQDAIDSQRKVFEIEKQAQKKEYEKTIADLRKKMQIQQEQAVKAQERAVELAIAEYQERIEVLDPVVSDKSVLNAMDNLNKKKSENVLTADQLQKTPELSTDVILEGQSVPEPTETEVASAQPTENLNPSFTENSADISADVSENENSEVASTQNAENISADVSAADQTSISVAETEVASTQPSENLSPAPTENSANTSANVSAKLSSIIKKNSKPQLFADNSDKVNAQLKDIESISKYVDSIPYENGLSKYVVAMGEIAENVNQDLKVMATEEISAKQSQIDSLNGLIGYFDSVYAKGKKTALTQDGVVVAKNADNLVCYVLPQNRKKAEKTDVVFKAGSETVVCKLTRVGDFFVATPDNKKLFDKIQLNDTFSFVAE